jgi:hypothetical protein
MKNIKIAIIFLTLPYYSYSQISNYIGNPGFEDFEGNYWDIFELSSGHTYSCVGPTISGYIGSGTAGVKKYWSFVPYWDVPKNRFLCQSLPTPDIQGGGSFSIQAHSGSFYAGVGTGEYFCQNMIHQMEDNHEYYIQYYGKSGTEKAGLGFSNKKPEICDHLDMDKTILWLDGFPQNDNDFPIENQYSGNENWEKIHGYYYPSGNKKWVTIGVFGSQNASGQTTYGLKIDDIKIYDMGVNQGCPENRTFENTDFDDLEILYRASNSIKAGNDVEPDNDVTGLVTVESNSYVTFRAGNEIALLDGFSALPGSNFSAYIAPCECNPIWSNAGESFNLCGVGQTRSLGMAPIANATAYLWTADPPEAIDYLSDPTSPNPTFTGPSDPIAPIFHYTLKVIGQCPNQISSSSLSVNYSEQLPITNSTFSNFIATYNTSDRTIEISALTGNKTIEVKIEIFTGSSLLNSYTLQREDDFLTGAIDYIPSNTFSDCKDYTIKISGRSVCYDDFGEIFEYSLNLPNPPSLNLISPVAPNLSNLWVQEGTSNFCVTTEGAESITLEIIAGNNGNILYSTSVFTSVTSHETCIWNGSDGNLNDGWYPFILTIKGCNNETQEVSGSFQYNASNKLEESDSSSNNNSPTTYYFLHPNPNTGHFTISQMPDYIKKWQLSSVIGQVLLNGIIPQGIKEHEIDITSISKGTYILQLETREGFKVEQVIYH